MITESLENTKNNTCHFEVAMASPLLRKKPTIEAAFVQPSSPRFPYSTLIFGAQRRIGIAIDLSDESAFIVKWVVQNYLRPGDAIILLHVCPIYDGIMAIGWVANDVNGVLTPPPGSILRVTFLKSKENVRAEAKEVIFGLIKESKERFQGIDQINCERKGYALGLMH